MEHIKINPKPYGYGASIIDLIDEHIKEFVSENFNNDKCKPVYITSLYNGDINNQHILVTIVHCGQSFTENIFPRSDTEYGYDCLDNLLIDMYNQTM